MPVKYSNMLLVGAESNFKKYRTLILKMRLKEGIDKIRKGKYSVVYELIVTFIVGYVLYFYVLAQIFNTPAVFSSVFSNSMVPVFFAGDMTIVYNDGNYKVGDIVVYNSKAFHRPIIHRIIAAENGYFTIKGDANPVADPEKVSKEQIEGRVIFKLPALGYVKILAEDFVMLMRTNPGTALLVILICAALAFGYEKYFKGRM